MDLTYSAAVIGLSTVIVTGTVLPFSTSGGPSIMTLPLRTGAAPTTLRMAASMVAGVARLDFVATTETSVMLAARRAVPARKARRVALFFALSSVMSCVLIAQRHQIGYHILDLLGSQDGLALKRRRDPLEAIDPIIGRHDGVGLELRGIDDPQPQLSLGRACAGAFEAGRQ